MLTGKLYFANTVGQACNLEALGFKVIYAGEGSPIPPSFIRLPILLPPIDAVDADVNDNIGLFENIYFNHLAYNEAVLDTIATIIVALYHNTNLVIYMEGEGLRHIPFFRNFMVTYYGIAIGDENIAFSYNPAFNTVIGNILYSYMDGFISYPQFISILSCDPNYLQTLSNPLVVIFNGLGKLAMELRVPIEALPAKIYEISQYQKRFMSMKGPLITIEE